MTSKVITLIRDLTRLKIVFTIESFKPLRIRVFTRRGLMKVQKRLDFRKSMTDDLYEEVSDNFGKEVIRVFFKREVKVKKTRKRK